MYGHVKCLKATTQNLPVSKMSRGCRTGCWPSCPSFWKHENLDAYFSTKNAAACAVSDEGIST